MTVCHYPIGQRLFSHISLNWAGKPLRSFELMTHYVALTTTRTGLTVTAALKRGGNEFCERVEKFEAQRVNHVEHTVATDITE